MLEGHDELSLMSHLYKKKKFHSLQAPSKKLNPARHVAPEGKAFWAQAINLTTCMDAKWALDR